MAAPVTVAPRVAQDPARKDELIIKSFQAGLRFADFVHEVRVTPNKRVILSLLSKQLDASISDVTLCGDDLERIMILVHFQARDKGILCNSFFHEFEISTNCNKIGICWAKITRNYNSTLLILNQIGELNFISKDVLSDFERAFKTQFEPAIPSKKLYAYEINTRFPIQQVLLKGSELPQVNFIAHLTNKTVTMILSDLEFIKNLGDHFNHLKENFTSDQCELVCEKPEGVARFFEHVFKNFYVPEEAEATVRGNLALASRSESPVEEVP